MEKNNFIDFIENCSKNPTLTKDFILLLAKEDLTINELKQFLDKHCALDQNDLAKIFNARNNICKVLNGQLKY